MHSPLSPSLPLLPSTQITVLPPSQVHARDKLVDPKINWLEVARSMAGFTGADCMGLMQRAGRMAARQVGDGGRGRKGKGGGGESG